MANLKKDIIKVQNLMVQFQAMLAKGEVLAKQFNAMGKTQQPSLSESVDEMEENLDAYLRYEVIKANIQKARFDALIEAGFNEQQAMYLTKREGEAL